MDSVNFEPERTVVSKGSAGLYELDIDNLDIITGNVSMEELEDGDYEELFLYSFIENPDGSNYGIDVFVDKRELADQGQEVWYVWNIGDAFRHVQKTEGETAAMILHTIKYFAVASWIASRIALARAEFPIISSDNVAFGDQSFEAIFDGIIPER